MKTSSKGQTPWGSGVTRYRPTITGQQKPMRHQGLGEVHERSDDGRCHCGIAWNLHPLDVLDASSAKIAGAARNLPQTQQRLTVERMRRPTAPNVEVAVGGQWVKPGVPA